MTSRIPIHVSRKRSRPSGSSKARRGLILVAVLICLAAAGLAVAAILKATAVELKQLRAQQQQLQAVRLAADGIERARAQLGASPTYTGETWNIAADDLGGAQGATVTITVEDVINQPQRRHIRAQADYPQDPERRVRKSRDAIVDVPRQLD